MKFNLAVRKCQVFFSIAAEIIRLAALVGETLPTCGQATVNLASPAYRAQLDGN